MAKNEPVKFSTGFDTILQFKVIANKLRDGIKGINGSFPVEKKPAFCYKNLNLNFTIPTDGPYPFLDDFVKGLNKINQITSGDGVIGKLVNAIKDYACEVSTVPGALTFFGEQLANYLENRKAVIPSAVAGKLFNGINFYARRFIDNHETNVDVPCLLNYWNLKQISIGFGVGFQLSIFPPKGFTFGSSFSCSSLDCWGCVTGLSEVLSLIPINKRSILQNNSDSNKTTTFLASDFSSSTNTKCVHYICERGTWNDNVCACVCNADNEIWTPQYGCYSSQDYENGNAPNGAYPRANPNNPSYDPTIDPYSTQYDKKKDPYPYYSPYTVVTTVNGGYVMTVCILLLLSILF